MSTVKRGQTIRLPADTRFWFERSVLDMQDLERAAREAGRFLDSAGEPIIHDRMGSSRTLDATDAKVVRCSGIRWTSWYRRPRGLVEVEFDLGSGPQVVLVVAPKNGGGTK